MWRAWVLGAALGLVALPGCVAPDADFPRRPSTAFDRPRETRLGRDLAPRVEAHPGESGLVVLASGLDAFAARILLVDAAERAIDVQYYILHDDVTGRFLLSRLLAAADRGVRVRLLVDDLGSAGIDPLTSALDAHPDVEVRLFNPFARGPSHGLARVLDLLRRPRRLNHRMHNKLLAVDGIASVVGGRNVGDEYFEAAEAVNFADLDLLAVGPVVDDLGESFDRYWNSPFATPVAAWSSLRAGPAALEDLRDALAAHERENADTDYARRLRASDLVRDVREDRVPLVWAPARAVADRPEKIVARGEALEETLLLPQIRAAFGEARSELLVVSPYLIPGDDGVRLFREAAARGVRVRILTNSLAATDVPAVHAGYAEYRRALLEAGVELYELKPGGAALREAAARGLFGSSGASLHAKTYGVDRRVLFVGSMNLDPRSVDLNTELGLVVESPELAARQWEGVARVTAPELSWQLALEGPEGAREIVWRGREDGTPERHARDPDTSWWSRFTVALLGWLPIEGQL